MKVVLIVLSFLPFLIKAKECDWSEKSFEKNLAANIGWSYEYYTKNNKMYFDITATNIYEDLYIVNDDTKEKYSGSEVVVRNVSDNQKLHFLVYSKICEEQVADKYITLPVYNPYHDTEYCKGISEFSLCSKWIPVSSSMTEKMVKQQTDEYREKLAKPVVIERIKYETDITCFYVFIALIIIALTLLLVFIIRGKREKDFI